VTVSAVGHHLHLLPFVPIRERRRRAATLSFASCHFGLLTGTG
jgi:hypothetical protein